MVCSLINSRSNSKDFCKEIHGYIIRGVPLEIPARIPAKISGGTPAEIPVALAARISE